jgi:hypothetical protein
LFLNATPDEQRELSSVFFDNSLEAGSVENRSRSAEMIAEKCFGFLNVSHRDRRGQAFEDNLRTNIVANFNKTKVA